MARIRSIKPDFWKDGRIARLSKDCALFFIGLWNFCDDEGKARADCRELSLAMPSFRSQDIVKHLSRLAQSGLIQLSTNREWIVVTNWNHQKIDKPRRPSVLKSEIEWLPALREDHSSNVLRTIGEGSSNVRRKDRIGKDRIGKDGIPYEGVTPNAESESQKILSDTSSTRSVSSEVWVAYEGVYLKRYGEIPRRNAKVNGQLAQFVQRLSREEAPLVAEFYLGHNDSFYVKSLHPVGLLLRDAEALRTQWARGRAITGTDAREVERKQSTFNAFAKYMEPAEASNGDPR